MSKPTNIGPWMGVPKEKQHVCAVKDCITPGKPHACFYDGGYHHHGCIHYSCAAVDAEKLGLKFHEDAWALLCDFHYTLLYEAFQARQAGIVG